MFTKSKMTDARREVFYAELHALLTAGLDFSHAFALLIEGEREVRMKALLERLYGEVVGGAALWQAMERSGVFRALDCGVVRIGEQTGRLPDTLDFLRDYYRKRAAQRRMVSSAVSYPLVILCTAVAVVAFMLAVIVPMFEQVYSRMGGELPAMTRRIISLSRAFPTCLTVAALAGAGTLLWWKIYGDRPSVQRFVCGWLLRIPIVGDTLKKSVQARFCRLLGLLASSGVPLLQGIGMLEGIIVFYPYRISFARIVRELERGACLSEALERFADLYDRRLVTLLRVGEQTGRLSEMLAREGDVLTAELEHRLRLLGNLLEPVLILLVGLLVAVILVAMHLPMFRLGGIMG